MFLKARPTTWGWGVFSQGDNVVQDSRGHGTRDTPVLVETEPQAVLIDMGQQCRQHPKSGLELSSCFSMEPRDRTNRPGDTRTAADPAGLRPQPPDVVLASF